MDSLRHEAQECEKEMATLLSVYPYDFVSKYAKSGFSPENPHFRLPTADDVMKDVVETGLGGNCVILPEILRRRLQDLGLTAQLIANTTREHVALCLSGENGGYVICDPGLLCVRPFVVHPESTSTEIFEVDNPGGNDKFGFRVTFRPDQGEFTINKEKAKSGCVDQYTFDLTDLGDLRAVRETDIKTTLENQIPVVAKLVMPRIGKVTAVDAVSVRSNRAKVIDFAVRNGITGEALWERIKSGNKVRRALQAHHFNGGEVDWV
ncbi:hypothetical protein KKC94_01060 [Patescibacteria group bacterium]|nr:hypothetical protein [Patescibacteria group bacterium]